MRLSVTLKEQVDLEWHSNLQASNKELSVHCGDTLTKSFSEVFGFPHIFGSPLFHHMAWFPIAKLAPVLEVSDEDGEERRTLKIQH